MPSKYPSEYTQEEVNVWLNSIGLGSKVDEFKENAIDGSMLVTLSPDDLQGDLGLSNLQVRKFQQALDFAVSLAAGGSGGGDNERLAALEGEIQKLREENASLKMINKELYEQINNAGRTTAYAPAPAPVPPPQQQYHQQQPPPPQQYYAPAPAPHRNEHHVVKGAAGGAAKGAVIGAIGGAIAGDPAQGAKMGAAMGGASGGMQGIRRQRLGARRF
jgi:ABC-type transport system substrate-binding protein